MHARPTEANGRSRLIDMLGSGPTTSDLRRVVAKPV
jgi:hypothetical protein